MANTGSKSVIKKPVNQFKAFCVSMANDKSKENLYFATISHSPNGSAAQMGQNNNHPS